MVLQLQVWAFMLLQEAAPQRLASISRTMWSNMGWPATGHRDHAVHHVGVVHRRHDRPSDRL